MNGDDILFFEAHAAAQSQKNAWTRMASTFSCMMITLSSSELTIKPHWYASPLIRLLCLDLHHRIPAADIVSAEEAGRSAGYGKVSLKFRVDGDERTIFLYLKDHSAFIDAIGSAV